MAVDGVVVRVDAVFALEAFPIQIAVRAGSAVGVEGATVAVRTVGDNRGAVALLWAFAWRDGWWQRSFVPAKIETRVGKGCGEGIRGTAAATVGNGGKRGISMLQRRRGLGRVHAERACARRCAGEQHRMSSLWSSARSP